jgi:hypothetical protein
VSFLEPNENTSPLEKVVRLLGECVHDGGYNVTSEILSFLSPAHLPVQITPTRWKPTVSVENGSLNPEPRETIFVMLDPNDEIDEIIESNNDDDDDDIYGVDNYDIDNENDAENDDENEEEHRDYNYAQYVQGWKEDD